MNAPKLTHDSRPLLDEQALSELIGVPAKTLQRWRSTGQYGPRYVKVGNGVRYRPVDVDRWLDANTRGGSRADAVRGL